MLSTIHEYSSSVRIHFTQIVEFINVSPVQPYFQKQKALVVKSFTPMGRGLSSMKVRMCKGQHMEGMEYSISDDIVIGCDWSF